SRKHHLLSGAAAPAGASRAQQWEGDGRRRSHPLQNPGVRPENPGSIFGLPEINGHDWVRTSDLLGVNESLPPSTTELPAILLLRRLLHSIPLWSIRLSRA